MRNKVRKSLAFLLVKKPNTPKTGDSANLTLWTCLLAASALGIITLLAALLKRNQK